MLFFYRQCFVGVGKWTTFGYVGSKLFVKCVGPCGKTRIVKSKGIDGSKNGSKFFIACLAYGIVWITVACQCLIALIVAIQNVRESHIVGIGSGTSATSLGLDFCRSFYSFVRFGFLAA